MTGPAPAHRRRGALAGLALLALAAGADGTAAESEAPESPPEAPPETVVPRRAYAPGEHLSYTISWAAIPAGKSSMSVAAAQDADGNPVNRFVSVARSNKAISLIYKVRDRIVSQVDAVTALPQRIDISQRHGRRVRIRGVVFDQAAHRATTYQEGREPVTVETPPGVHDIISCLYAFRSMPDLEVGRTVTLDVHEGKKNWKLLVHVESRQRTVVPAGTFDTLRVRAEVLFQGVFFDRGDVFLWITDDERHVPVQVSVKIRLGRVLAALDHMTLPDLPPADPPAPSSGGGAQVLTPAP